jgi:transposase InsO family protein
VKVYRFVRTQKADFDVTTLCRVCAVSRSAYYAWEKRAAAGLSDRLVAEAYLANRIYDIWKESRGRYGVPRVTAALWRQDTRVNPKKVGRIMAELGICGIHGRRKVKTTRADKAAAKAPDLVERDFAAERPDELWVGDVTYIPTDQGWVFLSSVLDVFSRRLLGWSLAGHLRTELCTDALVMAAATRRRARFCGTVFHTDHGCQYTSTNFKSLCRSMGIVQSMGTVGDSYDNALAESFWASLKRELIDDHHFTTKQEARRAVFEWIMWYNNRRLHSSLGYVPPVEFEQSPDHREAA